MQTRILSSEAKRLLPVDSYRADSVSTKLRLQTRLLHNFLNDFCILKHPQTVQNLLLRVQEALTFQIAKHHFHCFHLQQKQQNQVLCRLRINRSANPIYRSTKSTLQEICVEELFTCIYT